MIERERLRATGLVLPMVGRDPGEDHRVSTPLELLFDLSFVVAIAAAASQLHHEVSAGHLADGVGGYLPTFFAIWWAWMNFTWFASAFDTDDVPYRLLTFVQIVGVLVLAVGVPDAFAGDFVVVTVGYVIMRVAMVSQWLRASRTPGPRQGAARRYAVGIALVQVGWICRIWLPDALLSPSFALLVLCELAVPAVAEAGTAETGWHPDHIAERYGLFTIIVIGESILSATAAIRVALDTGMSGELLLLAAGSVVLVFGLWWLYFERRADEPLRGVTRGAFWWGYGHYVLFASLAALGAGIAVAAEQPEPGHALALSSQGQALAVAIPAAVALATVALLQHFLHREQPTRTVRLVGGALVMVAISAVEAVPLGPSVALMGLVLAVVVGLDVMAEARRSAT